LAVYNSECILVAHASGQDIIARQQNLLTKSCRMCFACEYIVQRSRMLANWNDASTENGPLCHAVIEHCPRLASASTRLLWCWHVSTCCNKDDV